MCIHHTDCVTASYKLDGKWCKLYDDETNLIYDSYDYDYDTDAEQVYSFHCDVGTYTNLLQSLTIHKQGHSALYI